MIPNKKKLRGILFSRRRRVVATVMEIFSGIPMAQQRIFVMSDAMPILIGLKTSPFSVRTISSRELLLLFIVPFCDLISLSC
jgi:hypothetical protein